MKTAPPWNWTHKKYLIETFPSVFPWFPLADKKKAPFLQSLITQNTSLFYFILFVLATRIFHRETSGRHLEEEKKTQNIIFLECGRSRHRCWVAVIYFHFFFNIRPSARDYGPQWLWITCRGLARSPVTKSFWRINRPHRHSTIPFFFFFSPCFARYGFKSVWGPRWHCRPWMKVGEGRAHVTIWLWWEFGSQAAPRSPLQVGLNCSDLSANKEGRFDFFFFLMWGLKWVKLVELTD